MFEKDYGIQGKGGGVLFYFIYLFILFYLLYLFYFIYFNFFILFILKYDYLLKEPQIRRQKKSP